MIDLLAENLRCRIGNLNVQLVMDNFSTHKYYVYELQSCPLQVENLNCQFYELPSHFWIKLKGINLHKLCEKAILIKCILTLAN